MALQARRFDPDGQATRLAAIEKAIDEWNAAQTIARAAELAPPSDDGGTLRKWFAGGQPLDSRSVKWTIEGAAARVVGLYPDGFSGHMPKPGVPALSKARIHVQLPAVGTEAGFCFDVAGPHDYAIATLRREQHGLVLNAFRHTSGRWQRLGRMQVRLDAWRLDGWHQLHLEATADGITARSAGAELKLDRKRLGLANGRFGICASNGSKADQTIDVRAFAFGGE